MKIAQFKDKLMINLIANVYKQNKLSINIKYIKIFKIEI